MKTQTENKIDDQNSNASKLMLQDGFSDYELDNEYWIDIFGFDGIYQVSNLGRIKSLKRHVEHPIYGSLLVQERIRKFTHDKIRGESITLSNNGVNILRMVHQIVAKTFIKNPLNFNCVRHLDGNKKNNRIKNLEWFTLIDSKIISNKNKIKTSNYNGVYFLKSQNRWRATMNSKTIGSFKTETEAINARKEFCLKNNIRFLYESKTIL